MADTAEKGAGFWLPSEFLEDFLSDNEISGDSNGAEPDSDFCFPTEFPYEFEPHGGANLQKRWNMSTSPQSTLAHAGIWSGRSAGGSSHGSPNGVTSPGKQNDAVADLIYRAAGQVARLKLNGGDVLGPTKHNPPLAPPRYAGQFYPSARNPNPSVFQNIHMYQVRNGREICEDAWAIRQNPTRIAGTRVLLGGSGGYDGGAAAVKRKSVGTGVFLPRRYENNNDVDASYSDSRKRLAGYSAAFVPARNSVHVLNKNVDYMNSFVHSHPKFERGFIPNYDLLMAGRNGLVFASPPMFASGRLAIPSSPGVDLFI